MDRGDIILSGVALANEYAGFHRGQILDFEKDVEGLGFSVAYHGGSRGESTIYIYDKRLSDIPNGPMHQTVLAEFNRTTDEVLALPLGKLPPIRQVELVARYGTGAPERGQEFLCAEFIVTKPEGAVRSFLYLTGALGRFIKIRVTLNTNDEADPAARNFADAAARRLWEKPSLH